MADSYYEKTLTLAASAARTPTAGTNGTAFELDGKLAALMVVCEFTAKGTDATDTADVYVDVLVGALWINAIHFTQALGNGTDAAAECAVICPGGGNTAITSITADAASGVVRPNLFGSSVRARWIIVNTGAADASFTFSVTAYGI